MNILLQVLAAMALIVFIVWVYWPWLTADLPEPGPTIIARPRQLIYEYRVPGWYVLRYSDGTREYVSKARRVEP